MLKHLKSVEIGTYDFWIKYSDHVPVIVNFDTTLFHKRATAQQNVWQKTG
jgi:hypothetical protein